MKDFYLLTYLLTYKGGGSAFSLHSSAETRLMLLFYRFFFLFEDKLLMVLSYIDIQIKYFRMTSVSKIRKMKMGIT